jgi:hypothetical protein
MIIFLPSMLYSLVASITLTRRSGDFLSNISEGRFFKSFL